MNCLFNQLYHTHITTTYAIITQDIKCYPFIYIKIHIYFLFIYLFFRIPYCQVQLAVQSTGTFSLLLLFKNSHKESPDYKTSTSMFKKTSSTHRNC